MKNWIIVLLVFVIPLSLYGFLSAKAPTNLVANAKNNAVVYKFTSPMCSECKKVAEILNVIKPKYPTVIVEEVDVGGNKYKKGNTKVLIDKYDITTVPTLVFVDKNGTVVEKFEVDMTQEQVEKNFKVISGNK